MWISECVNTYFVFLVEREKRVACIRIPDGAIGYSYGTLFGEYLDNTVEKVEIDDPYIRASHQVSETANLYLRVLEKWS